MAYGELVYLGLMAASVAAQEAGNQAVKREQQDLFNLEQDRQKKLGDKSRAVIDQSINNLSPTSQLQQKQQATEDLTKAYTVSPQDYLPQTQSAETSPKEVKQEAARQVYRTVEDGKGYARRKAGFDSYGNLTGNNAISQQKAYDQLGVLQDFSRGSGDVLGQEFQGAYDKATPYKNFADLAGLAGSAYSMYQMSRPQTDDRAGTFDPMDPSRRPGDSRLLPGSRSKKYRSPYQYG